MFSKTAEYAIRATLYIAQKSSEENKLGIAEIARAIDSPQSFTAKILQVLTKDNKIISSSRGPNGGFFLSPKAGKLPLMAILEIMGEDEGLKKCVLGLHLCSETKPCPLHAKYKPIKAALIDLFNSRTIQHLANDIQSGVAFINSKKVTKK
jgi:Rrf2 family transcriptional regulator, iron-sulfur cluster assembly transcription factor